MGSKMIKPTRRKRKVDLGALTPMQRMFIEELLADEGFSTIQAAKRAGYKSPSAVANLLKNPEVNAALGQALQERINRCKLTATDVLNHLHTALFLDPLELFECTPNGAYVVRSLEDIPAHIRRCITKIKQRTRIVGEDTEVYLEVELMSKDSALVNAMKHLMLVSPDQSMNVNVGGVDLKELLDRVEKERNVIDGSIIESIANNGRK